MGQATVDLPDPLDAPPPSSLSGTDDLLAQLAGDEIDRLLAEADFEQRAAALANTPAGPAAAQSTNPTPCSDSTAVAPASDSTVAADQTAIASADAAIAASAPGDDELDALLSRLEEDAPKFLASTPPEAKALASAASAESEKSLVDRVPEVLAQFPAPPTTADETPAAPAAAAVALAQAPAAPDASDGVMSAAERDALKIDELADDETAASDKSEAVGPGRLAPLIKLLELLNAPLSFVPDALRDTLGKVAIVTLVNSIAVLIYVLFVRR
jgi:hypothetical protein